MKPVYLERIDHTRRMARFYCVRVEQTLFGDWALMCHWGRIGCKGQQNERWLPNLQQANEAQERQIARKIRRGYGVRTGQSAS